MKIRGSGPKSARMVSRRRRCVPPREPSRVTHWVIGLLLVALIPALLLTSQVRAQEPGVLQGQVDNGSVGGAEIGAGIPVNLYIFGDGLEEQILNTETDGEGRFVFEGLDTSATMQYWVEAIYQDVPYGSDDLLQFADGQTLVEATVTVYETTEDDAGVRLDLVHIFAESFGEVLRISETHLFGSTVDRAFVGRPNAEGQPETVLIPLPADTVGFALGEGIAEERFVTMDEGLIDSEPVRPGTLTSEVRFSYHLMATGKPIALGRRFAYPVTNLSVLVAQPGLTLTSGQLQSMGTQLIQDRQYAIFTGEIVDANTPVEFEFTQVAGAGTGVEGMPGGPAASSGDAGGSQSLLLWFGIGLALAAIAGVVVYAATSRRPAAAEASGPELTTDPRTQELIARLADLEDAYEAGELDEVAYVSQRMELFRELG